MVASRSESLAETDGPCTGTRRILVSRGRLTGAVAQSAARDPYLAALAAQAADFSLAPAELSPGEAASLAATASGLLLCGGVDVDPQTYGHEPRPWCGPTDPRRDERETALIEAALAQNLPILAICRGIQMLNVYLGGTLYQDIAGERPSSLSHRYFDGTEKWAPVHGVAVQPDSALAVFWSAPNRTSTAGITRRCTMWPPT